MDGEDTPHQPLFHSAPSNPLPDASGSLDTYSLDSHFYYFYIDVRLNYLIFRRKAISSSMSLSDLLNLLSFFMQPVTKASAAYDLNGDGIITTSDLILLLGQLG